MSHRLSSGGSAWDAASEAESEPSVSSKAASESSECGVCHSYLKGLSGSKNKNHCEHLSVNIC